MWRALLRISKGSLLETGVIEAILVSVDFIILFAVMTLIGYLDSDAGSFEVRHGIAAAIGMFVRRANVI